MCVGWQSAGRPRRPGHGLPAGTQYRATPGSLYHSTPPPTKNLQHLKVICTKVRDGDKRIVRLKEGEPRGRHVVIVDDLVQSGGSRGVE